MKSSKKKQFKKLCKEKKTTIKTMRMKSNRKKKMKSEIKNKNYLKFYK